MKKRTLALLMAVVMLFGITVGGTIAWLTAQSREVTNTFTVGDVEITFDETNYESTSPERDTDNEYKMIPGNKYLKDPIVHVGLASEPCYIFVELTETNNTYNTNDKVIRYVINSNWTLVEGTTNIYVYGTSNDVNDMTVVNASEDTSSVLEITGNTSITINENVKSAEFDAMGANTPKLVFKAYAIQSANLTATTAAEIWALANPSN